MNKEEIKSEIKEEKNIKNNCKNLKKIIISILLVICVLVVALIIYDRVTINNEYYIGEMNLYIPIFVYHDIVKEESEVKFDYMQTTAETFENQLNGLKNAGYHFINYEDLVEYKNGNKKLYKKSCILTFDDGYDGVYENAYPIAKKYEIPFTMFVITENMNTPECITWEQAKEMKESGLATIASHSIDHPEFTSLSTQEAVDNVNKSYEIIEQNLGKDKIKIFTYPYGLHTEEQLQALKEEGYIQNLTDNKINKSKSLNLYGLHRDYPLSDSIYKILLKIMYRSIRYD